jgi:hypothetical protein
MGRRSRNEAGVVIPLRSRSQRQRRFQILDGTFEIVAIHEADGTRRMPHRLTRRQIGHFFASVTRAGAASGRPYERKGHGEGNFISDLKFEIGETATATPEASANADPSPLKGIRDDSAFDFFRGL